MVITDTVLARTITFSWEAPLFEERNGVIVSYDLIVTLLGTSNDQQYTTSSTSYTVTGLIPYSYYTYAVAASTVIGTGPYTAIATVMTMEDGEYLQTVLCHMYMNDPE